MTYTISLIVFMQAAGYSLFDSSLIIGLCRLIPILSITFFGQIADSLPPKLTVVVSEVCAAIGSLGIYWAWGQGKPGYALLVIFSVLRTLILSLQYGSRQRIVKSLGDSTYKSQSKHAVWLNQMTQGSMLFAGIVSWIAIRNFKLEYVIIFDGVTFLINGLTLLVLPIGKIKTEAVTHKIGTHEVVTKKFRDFYHWNPRAAVLDLALAMMMMGTMSFTSRLAGNNQAWLSIFMISYGLSVWISGYFERTEFMKDRTASLWALLGVSYIFLGLAPAMGVLTWGLCLAKDVTYWILFHRISSYIQADTPAQVIGSVTNARGAQMVIVLALGELLVGRWQGSVPVAFDGLWRGVIGVGLAGIMIMVRLRQNQPEPSCERPAL